MKALRLLLVSDSVDDARLIVHEFERDTYLVEWRRVEDEPSLRAALLAAPWDVVIADALPRFDALSALAVVRAVAPSVPVIIVSGLIGEDAAVAAMKGGASDYVMKSNLRRLVVATSREVDDACERRRHGREGEFLMEASRVLAASLDWDETLSTLASFITRSLADWCVISVVDVDGEQRFTAVGAVQHEDALLEAFADQPCSALERVLAAGPPERVARVTEAWIDEAFAHPAQRAVVRMVGARSAIVLPVRARGRVIGAMLLVASWHELDDRVYALADDLAQRAALAVDNARLYRQAQSAIRAREEFVAVAAHDLRTPLSTLSLAVQSLSRSMRKGGTRGQVEGLLAVAERSAARVTRLADDLLDITRLGVGRMKLELEELDLTAIVREAAEDASRLPNASRVCLELETEDALIGRWDRKRVEQLLANLLSNAVKYGAGKPIEVVVSADDDTAMVRVCDQGIGIAPESRERIFRRFERATTERAGLGLGLYIAKELATLLGGSIEVESVLGEGSTFILTLPLAGPRVANAPSEARATVH